MVSVEMLDINQSSNSQEKNPISNPSSSVRKTIKSRRVTRSFTNIPIPRECLYEILEAARWAPSGGMRRLNFYIVIQDNQQLAKIRAASPGILGFPMAIILVCIDTSKTSNIDFDDSGQGSAYIDVGTATENMLLAATEIGIGACPVMSFHKSAIRTLLNLPSAYDPSLMVLLGFPAPGNSEVKAHLRVPKLEEIVRWERGGGEV